MREYRKYLSVVLCLLMLLPYFVFPIEASAHGIYGRWDYYYSSSNSVAMATLSAEQSKMDQFDSLGGSSYSVVHDQQFATTALTFNQYQNSVSGWFASFYGPFLDYETGRSGSNNADSISFAQAKFGSSNRTYVAQGTSDLADAKSVADVTNGGYPILLNNNMATIPSTLKSAFTSLNSKDIVIMGGTAMFNDIAGIGDSYDVIRVGGYTRMDTYNMLNEMSSSLFTSSRPTYNKGNYTFQVNTSLSTSSTIENYLKNGDFDNAAKVLISTNHGSETSLSNGTPAVVIGCNNKFIKTYWIGNGIIAFQYFGPTYFAPVAPPANPSMSVTASANPNTATFNGSDVQTGILAIGTVPSTTNVKSWTFKAKLTGDASWDVTHDIYNNITQAGNILQMTVPKENIYTNPYTQQFDVEVDAHLANGTTISGTATTSMTITTPPAPKPKFPPIANLYMQSTTKTNRPVAVTNGSYDMDGYITNVQWSISPNSGISSNTLGNSGGSLTFSTPGTYTVTLTVTDNDGLTATAQKQITVVPLTPPTVSIQAPAQTGLNIPIGVVNTSVMGDETVQSWNWTVTPSDGATTSMNEPGGIITFTKPGTYSVTLNLTTTDGFSGSDTKTIDVINLPPVASFNVPSQVYQGANFDINDYSLDPDGSIAKYDWSVSPSNGSLVGTLNGDSTISNLYFDTEGTYQVTLTVTDQFGATNTLTKTVDVMPAIPTAVLQAAGTLKQNRLVQLISKDSTSPVAKYPIDVSQTQWQITPLTAGVTSDDIKIDTTSSLDNRNVLFKKPGDYQVQVRVSNGKHYSDWVSQTITIAPDEAPVANFTMDSLIYRDPGNGNKITATLNDASYSPDMDTIASRVWKYKYDSNNDGSFDDEQWVYIGGANDEQVTFNPPGLGKYLVELQVQEALGQPTIDQFVTSSDRLTANTNNKPLAEKIFTVDNIAPYVSFSASPKPKADIVFTVGQTDPSKTANLNSLINSNIVAQLKSNNVDVQVSAVQGYRTETVLVLQDNEAWASGSVVYNTIRNLGYNVVQKSSADLPSLDLSPYSHIYIPSDQDQQFYNVLNNYMGKITQWISGGGILIFNAADEGWHGGQWTQGPGGLQHVPGAYQSNIVVTMPNTPVTQGLPTYISGNYAAHSYFTNVPANAKVYMTTPSGQPVVVEYPYGNGLIFAQTTTAEYYSTNSGALSPYLSNEINYTVTKVLAKSLNDALQGYTWRDDAYHFVVDLTDVSTPEFNNDDSSALILSELASESVDFDALGTSTNQAELTNFIARNSGKGIFIDNGNISDALTQLGNYILNKVQVQTPQNVQYILLGQDLNYKTTYNDNENDPLYQERWQYTQDANYYDNSLGVAAFNGQYLSNPVTNFDKVGKYVVNFQAQDNPVGTDDRFANYRKWSEEANPPMIVYVNRKPIAQFSVVATPSGSNYVTTTTENSYDPDHTSMANKGLINKEWKWKNVNDINWNYGQLPSVLPVGNDYIVQLRVQDCDGPNGVGFWSDPVAQVVSTKNINLAPVAQFTATPNPLPISKSLSITDNSYDPNGDPIASRNWTITRASDSSALYSGSSQPTNFAGYGVGDYIVSLTVTDSPRFGLPLTSQPYSQIIHVIPDNQPPVANFSVSPNPVPTDVNVGYTDNSYDPDGDPIVAREWQVLENGNWVDVSSPPINFAFLGVGTQYVRERVEDQPSLPQLDPLWSNFYTVAVTVIPGNKPPVASFTVSPNPVPADEPVTYNNYSYDPEGKPLAAIHWKITCNETGQSYDYYNQTPPTVFENTGWGAAGDGVGTYTVALQVEDISPNGMSPALWSSWATQTLVVEDPLKINALQMTSIVNPPEGTVAPINYPVATPTPIKAGYQMTFQLNTNGGDVANIELFSNGQPLTVHTASGDTNTITFATVRKNSVNNFTFWTDKTLPKGTTLDMKIVLTKTRYDGTTKSIVDTVLGNQFGKIVGSALEDSSINLTN